MSPPPDDSPPVFDEWPQPTPEVLRGLESSRTSTAAWAADDADDDAETHG